MAYNKAKEEYRWNQWKAEEEKILREQGVDEETFQKLREYDWDDFKAERRFREHQTSLLDCMEMLLEEKETEESQPDSVEALLDTVENEELLQILLSTDKKTLQMIVLKMMGYAPKEISHELSVTTAIGASMWGYIASGAGYSMVWLITMVVIAVVFVVANRSGKKIAGNA